MTEKHYIITLTENITVKEARGEITRNSNGSQWIDVELDGWKLGEGEVLYISFEHYNEDEDLTTRIGPLQLFYNFKLQRYLSLIPPELISKAGEWSYSVEKRFNIEDLPEAEQVGEVLTTLITVTDGEGNVISETEKKSKYDRKVSYDAITSAIETFTVIDSVMRATESDSFVKEAELVSAAKTFEDTRIQVAEDKQKAEEARIGAEAAQDAAEVAQSITEDARDEAVSAVRDAEFKYNKSIASTEIAYRVSDSGTELTEGEWTSTIPEAKAGQFLWTRTTYIYNDGSRKEAYSIGKMGNNGFYALTNGLFSFRVDDDSNLYCDFVDNGKEDSPKFRYDEETGNLFYIIDDNIPDNGTVITPGTIYLGNLKGKPGKDGTNGGPGLPGRSAYEIAKAYGFTGTEFEWLNSLKGADGVDGVDGVDGEDGAVGQDGTSITDFKMIDYKDRGNYTVTIVRVKSTDGDHDFDVYARNGTNGVDGVGIKNIVINANGELIITPTVGDSINLGIVVGADGKPGESGEKGEPGEDGKTPYIGANGNWFINGEDTGVKAQGEPGQPGVGVDGASAYEIAVANGFVGTEQEWLESLKGKPGESGEKGEPGEDGKTPYIGENGNWWIGEEDTGVSAGGYIIGEGVLYGTKIDIQLESFRLIVQLQTPVGYNTSIEATPSTGMNIASPAFLEAFDKVLKILYAAGYDGTSWTTNLEGYSNYYIEGSEIKKDSSVYKPPIQAVWSYEGTVLNTTVNFNGTVKEMRINESLLKLWNSNGTETYGRIEIISRDYPEA